MTRTGPVLYSEARAVQLRGLLWAAIIIASVLLALAIWVLAVGGSLRYVLFVSVPGLLVLAAAVRSLRLMRDRGPAARWGVLATGVLLVFVGLVLASATLGLIPSITGVLLLLLAVLPDIGDR